MKVLNKEREIMIHLDQQEYSREPHTKEYFQRDVDGRTLYVRVAPGCWMHPPSLLRLIFMLEPKAMHGSSAFMDYLDLAYQSATDNDIENVITGWVASGGMPYLIDKVAKYQAEADELQASQYALLQQAQEEQRLFLEQARKAGHQFYVQAVIHPAIGDDQIVRWSQKVKPSKVSVRHALLQHGSTILDDYKIFSV